jgi:hypothetical protein
VLSYWLIVRQVSTYQIDTRVYKYVFSVQTRELSSTTEVLEQLFLFPRVTNDTLRQLHRDGGNGNVGSKIWPACQTELYTVTSAAGADSAATDSNTDANANANANPRVYVVVLENLQFHVNFVDNGNDVDSNANSNAHTLSHDILVWDDPAVKDLRII